MRPRGTLGLPRGPGGAGSAGSRAASPPFGLQKKGGEGRRSSLRIKGGLRKARRSAPRPHPAGFCSCPAGHGLGVPHCGKHCGWKPALPGCKSQEKEPGWLQSGAWVGAPPRARTVSGTHDLGCSSTEGGHSPACPDVPAPQGAAPFPQRCFYMESDPVSCPPLSPTQL